MNEGYGSQAAVAILISKFKFYERISIGIDNCRYKEY